MGDIPKLLPAFLSAAIGAVVAAFLGTAPVSLRVESVAGSGTGRGIDRGKDGGGRTGLSAVFTGALLLLALFLFPLVSIIPSSALAPALVLAGFFLMWKYPTEAIPAFLTIIIMPFASIAEGIVYGVLSFVLIKTLTGKAKYIPVATWILSRTPLHPALPGFRLKDAWLKRLRRGQCGHGAMRAIDLFHTIPHTSPSQFKERSRPSALRKKAETAKNCNP